MTRPPAARPPESPPAASRPESRSPSQTATGPPASRPADLVLARWWRRLLAFVIDAVILTLATGALWGRLIASFAIWLGNAQSAGTGGQPADPGAVGRVFGHTVARYLIVLTFTICVAVLYYWLLTGYWGTTIGKRALGTWVVTASDGSAVGLPASLLRAVVFVLGGELIPLFFLVDNYWLTGDRRRQCLHDKAARTLVVRSAPPGRGPAQIR